jgi:hypothetical protein
MEAKTLEAYATALELAHRQTPEFDQPPLGWFVLDVHRKQAPKWDWVALMVDFDPDDLKTCTCDFPSLFCVDPKDYRPGPRKVRQCWVRIPGKHRNRDAAWDALDNALSTRH